MTLLAATGLKKSYAGVRVLDDVAFALAAGEVHALVGENGAGKSTLVKILAGAVVPDAGEVRLDETFLPLGKPLAVRRRGLSIVYQELTLVPELTVAENIFLGRERGRLFLRRADMVRETARLLEDLGLPIDPSAPVGGLSVGHQQMVEMARALAADARVLILDEPSSALSGREVERLLAVVRRLRARGLGLVYISHRLEEVFGLADRVTVLRDGRRVASAPIAGLDRRQLIRWMVGRDVAEEFPARVSAPGPVALAVRGLVSPPRVSGVSLTVRRGEIVGLAGLVGAGRTATGLALAGARPAAGDIRLEGAPVRPRSPAEALAAGIAYVTEDRKRRGLFPALGVDANITITSLRAFVRAGLIDRAGERRGAAAAARAFDIRAASADQPAATLSGGNQQKMLLARFLLRPRRVVILDEPTRGVDVGARAEIYQLMNGLAAQGMAVLMISSELPEVLGMSDRIVVMRDGRSAGELPRAEATPERVMALATGG